MLSDGFWRRRFNADPEIIGRTLAVEGEKHLIIGVLPAGFRFPAEADLWVPAELDGENASRTSHNYSAVGRLRDGVTVAQANQDISAIARRVG